MRASPPSARLGSGGAAAGPRARGKWESWSSPLAGMAGAAGSRGTASPPGEGRRAAARGVGAGAAGAKRRIAVGGTPGGVLKRARRREEGEEACGGTAAGSFSSSFSALSTPWPRPPPPPSSSLSSPQQQFLDLGQRDWARKQCAQCDMVYTPGTDDADHAAFCARVGRADSLWLGCPDPELVLPALPPQAPIDGRSWGKGEGVVVRICGGLRPAARGRRAEATVARVAALKRRVVDPAMGFLQEEEGPAPQLFVAVSALGMVQGLCSVERIAAHHVVSEALVRADGALGAAPPATLEGEAPAPQPARAVLGVRQVWVAPDSRRAGVASHLVEQACRHAVYGVVVPRSRVAFSQPTCEGARLALRLSGSERGTIRVYRLPGL
jgi:hypothetical protein